MEARDSPNPPGLQMQMQQFPAQPSSSMVAQPQGSLGSFYHHLHSGAGVFSQQQLLHQQHQQTQQQPSPHQQAQQLQHQHQQQQQQQQPQQQQQQQQQQQPQQQQQQRLQSSTGIRNPLLSSMIHSPAAMRHNCNPNANPNPSPTLNASIYPPETPPHMIPHSLNTTCSPPSGMGVATGMSTAIMLPRSDPVKRKRGRPRKYTVDANGTPLPQSSPSPYVKKASRGPSKKTQLSNYGANGQGFMPHVLTVEAGEDITSKIMLFLQQGPWAVCILSANGAISNASLRHAGVSSSAVMYEGRFEVLSLSGLFLLSEIGGTHSRTGGLSVSLAGPDGRVIGGKVAGLLMAASPVQIVLGTFFQENRKSQVQAGSVEGKPLDSEEKQQSLALIEHDGSGPMPDQNSNSVEGVDREHTSHHVMPLQSAEWAGSHFDLETSGHNEQI